MKPSILSAFLSFGILVSGCESEAQSPPSFELSNITSVQSEKHHFKVVSIVQGLAHPWGMAFIDEHQLLVTQRSGGLYYIHLKNRTIKSVTDTPAVFVQGQGGMLDIELHPDFKNNNLIYISYAGRDKSRPTSSGTELLQARLVLNSKSPYLTEQKVIFSGNPKIKSSHHFGGRIAVDDKYVYLSLGDRGQRDWAQDQTNHWGSMIRLYHDGSIPEDNPFFKDKNFRPEIYSYGHRNPQGLAWHPKTRILWEHEHGPQGGDEINIIAKGQNYGWPIVTSGKEYGTGFDIGEGDTKPGMQSPVYQWTPSIAPSGMNFYAGEQFPQWQDNLLVGSLKFKKLVRLELDGSQVSHSEDLMVDLIGRIRDVQVSPDGFIYLLTDEPDGELIQLKTEK